MATPPYFAQNHSPVPSADGQEEWIYVTVPVKVTTSPTSTTPTFEPDFSAFIPTTFPDTTAHLTASWAQGGEWDQQLPSPAGIFDATYSPAGSHSSPPAWPCDPLPAGPDFDIGLALELQACLDEQVTDAQSWLPSLTGFPSLEAELATSSVSFPSSLVPSPLIGAIDPMYMAASSSCAETASPSASNGSPPPCSNPSSLPDMVFCPEPTCCEMFATTSELRRHERRRHKRAFNCPVCNKGHADRRGLERHLWTRHEDYARRTGAKSEKTQCRFCDYESRADNVRRHEKSQHGSEGGRKQ